MLLYKAIGANYPRASLVVIFLLAGTIFGFAWFLIGREYREQNKPAPQLQDQTPTAPNPTAQLSKTYLPSEKSVVDNPDLTTTLSWTMGKNGIDLYNPMFKIFNNGPVKVVSLDVIYYSYLVDIDKNEFMGNSSLGFTKGNYKFIFKKELDIFEYEEKISHNLSIDFPDRHLVAVNIFDIKYYSHTDSGLKEHKRRDIYIIDNSVIFTEKEYMSKSPNYNNIISHLNNVSKENKAFLEWVTKHGTVFTGRESPSRPDKMKP